jgi:hypothetical protein
MTVVIPERTSTYKCGGNNGEEGEACVVVGVVAV